MEISGRNARQILLLSLVVMIVPMVIFPQRFGTGLARASMIYIAYELVYYMVASYVLTRRASLLPLAQAAGICLVYRLILGATFGLLIALMYSMDLKVSLTLGLSSYVPVLVLQIAAAPFILGPAIKVLIGPKPAGNTTTTQQAEETESPMEGKTTFVTTSARGQMSQPSSRRYDTDAHQPAPTDTPLSSRPGDANGFDRTTRYIGEDGTVQVAAVVDNEGLLLGHFQRGGAIAEDWAPLALLFCQQNQAVSDRFGGGAPERITLSFNDRRIIIARETSFYLMVVAEKQNDDVLNIRFSQGLEAIRKYIAERYGADRAVNAEKSYVRSAE